MMIRYPFCVKDTTSTLLPTVLVRLWLTVVRRAHLAEELLHEVDLADAPQLLLKNIDLKTNKKGGDQTVVDGGPTLPVASQAARSIHACQSRCVGAEQRS